MARYSRHMFVVLTSLACTYTGQAEDTIGECIEELFLPRYLEISRNFGSTGTVSARVHIEADFKPPRLEVTGGTVDLRKNVVDALSISKFKNGCVGTVVTVQFRFLIEKNSGTIANPKVTFTPPNMFTIRTSPGPLNFDQSTGIHLHRLRPPERALERNERTTGGCGSRIQTYQRTAPTLWTYAVSECARLEIYWTQVATICSMSDCGRISEEPEGARGEVRDGASMPGLPVPVALAGRFSVPALRRRSLLAGAGGAAGMRRLWPPNLSDRRDSFPRHAQAAGGLVSSDVLRYHPEERRQCPWTATSAGLGEL